MAENPSRGAAGVVGVPPKSAGKDAGIGRVLVGVYGILAIAASGRSLVQIVTRFDLAPVAYLLSALAAVVYILATVALVSRGRRWYFVAWATLGFELLGVIVVGLLSIFDPVLFPADTVWSVFGQGYLFVPLVLPVLGMLWLHRRRHITGRSDNAISVGEGVADARR